jgi:hypothetical protein
MKKYDYLELKNILGVDPSLLLSGSTIRANLVCINNCNIKPCNSCSLEFLLTNEQLNILKTKSKRFLKSNNTRGC